MKTKYLFSLVYYRGTSKKQVQYEEHIVTDSWENALKYWEIEFQDEGVDIISIKKQVPVVAYPGNSTRNL